MSVNNVNTQNLKFARRDRPHILIASHLYEAFEKNSFRSFTLKKLNDGIYIASM